MTAITDETAQRIAWKTRIVTALINRTFDNETMTELLFAALDEAHANGVKDAAYITRKIADGLPNSIVAESLTKLEKHLLALNIANKNFAGMLEAANPPQKNTQ